MRNCVAPSGPMSSGPSSEGPRIATGYARRHPSRASRQRPLFGGAEDRNWLAGGAALSRTMQRPLFGGAEDRNPCGGSGPPAGSAGSGPSSEGPRIATTPRKEMHCLRIGKQRPLFVGAEDRNSSRTWIRCSWNSQRPLFGGAEDRNTKPTMTPSMVSRAAAPLRRGRGSQPSGQPSRSTVSLCSGPSSEGPRIATMTAWPRRQCARRAAAPLRRGRGSQLQRRRQDLLPRLAAAPLRRGRGSQLPTPPARSADAPCSGPSSEGPRIATGSGTGPRPERSRSGPSSEGPRIATSTPA